MKYAKSLAILFYFISFISLSYSQTEKFSVQIEVQNHSEAIDDVSARVLVEGGQKPFRYFWNIPTRSIYDSEATGLSEGTQIEVVVIDANSDTVKASAYVEPESFQEHISQKMKPAVAFLQRIFFANIFSDTVKIDEYTIKAPDAINKNRKNYVLREWLKADGERVKHQEPIAVLEYDDTEFLLYAVGDGILKYETFEDKLIEKNENVSYINKRGNRTEKKLGEIIYETPQPYYFRNLTTKTQGIPLIVAWLVFGAVFFTFKMGFIQFIPKRIKHSFDLIRGKYDDPNQKHGEVSHFQALVTALSATIGLGNIAGVAIAISMGGPGATFWMIVAGFLGMGVKFVEATMGVKYRHQKESGEVSGGPMYYLSRGLAKRGKGYKSLGKVLAVVFAILCVGGSFGGGNMFQINNAFNQIVGIPGLEGLSSYGFYFGIVVAIFVGVVIVGGIKSIANVTDKIVPLMVGIYVLSALVIIGMNYENLGMGFQLIFSGAFDPDAIYGGVVGVIIIGFQRAAFSNEAGIGSSPIAHSAAKTEQPISEGTVALLEPFLDTVVVCTMTTLVIIFSGYTVDTEGLEGSALTSAAFASSLGDWAMYILSFAVFLFAFSTMISWSYYGLKAWTYLFGETKIAALTYKVLFLVFVVIGASIGLGAVLDFSDLMILGMAFPNILGLLIMSGEVRKDLKAYFKKVDTGEIKKFK